MAYHRVMSLAIRYLGDNGKEAAEDALRALLPDARLVRKVAGVLEVCAPMPPDLAARLPRDWLMYQPTEADIAPPRLNLQKVRKHLER